MTWVDLVVLAVLAISALLAFFRGFVREALGIAAWGAAIWIAAQNYGVLLPTAHRFIPDEALAAPVAFGVIFLVAVIVLSIVASLIGGMVRGSALGGLDRSLGLVFGLARGFALVVFAYIAAGMALPADRWPEPVLQARALPYVHEAAGWVAGKIPEKYRPQLAPLPASRSADASALMRPPAQGYALGSHAARDQESK